MKDLIISKLKEIERSENVRIIHAVESGSRAWGFASPDSDYDVRFIYIRPTEFYLKLENTRDVIEWQLDSTLDINGWDLQKALRLLHSSNPTLFEWSNSPIVYKTTNEWELVKKEIDNYFSVKKGLYHYLNTASSNYREYLKGDIVRLKKYFYVIRPLLACRWILARNCPPPVLFAELVETELDTSMKEIINNLLELKMKTLEMGVGTRINEINDFIDKNLIKIKSEIDKVHDDNQADWNRLNKIFIQVLSTEQR